MIDQFWVFSLLDSLNFLLIFFFRFFFLCRQTFFFLLRLHSDPTNADTHFAYEPFNNSQEENLREQYPRPSAPPVEFHPSFSERRPSLNIVSDGSTAYLTVDEAKPKQNAENDEIHYEQIVDEQVKNQLRKFSGGIFIDFRSFWFSSYRLFIV